MQMHVHLLRNHGLFALNAVAKLTGTEVMHVTFNLVAGMKMHNSIALQWFRVFIWRALHNSYTILVFYAGLTRNPFFSEVPHAQLLRMHALVKPGAFWMMSSTCATPVICVFHDQQLASTCLELCRIISYESYGYSANRMKNESNIDHCSIYIIGEGHST